MKKWFRLPKFMRRRKPEKRAGRFKYRDYQPAERRLLAEMDAQLAVPGHDPTTLYLTPNQAKLFRRAARRNAAFKLGDNIAVETYRGKWVKEI